MQRKHIINLMWIANTQLEMQVRHQMQAFEDFVKLIFYSPL